jgi:hypothetical protein
MSKVPLTNISITSIKNARNADGTSGTSSNTYSVLRNGANFNKFDLTYLGNATQLSQINNFSQWRKYPTDYEGNCVAYFIGSDGNFSTTFQYYEFPSGELITKTLSIGQSETVAAYDTPGVIIVSGDGTASSQGFCGAQPPPATIVVNCGTTYFHPNNFPPYKLFFRVNSGTGVGTPLYLLDSSVQLEPCRFVVTYNNILVIDTGYVSKDVNANANYLGRLNNTLTRLGEPTVTSVTYSDTVIGGINKNISSVQEVFVTVYSPLGGRFAFQINCV